MKTIFISTQPPNTVLLKDIPISKPIFMANNNKITGLLIKTLAGWIIRIGGKHGHSGWHPTRERAICKALDAQPTASFHIDVNLITEREIELA